MKKYIIFFILYLSFLQILGNSYKDTVIERAENGDLNCQKFLAEAYFEGKTNQYPKNLTESFKWLKKAADQGDSESQYRIYKYYENGIGCEKSVQLDYLFKSADNGYIPAMVELGIIYSQLLGKEDEGQRLLLESYEKGINNVLPAIAANYMKKGEYSQGLLYFNKAIQECEGYSRAQGYSGLSKCYSNGIGVEFDLKKSLDLINHAIDIIPDEVSYYEDKGIIYLKDGNIKKATEMWNKMIDIAPFYTMESTSELARAMNHSIDYGIPITNNFKDKTLAIIIANENYKRVPNVPHAINDGAVFKKYLTSTFGVPEENIQYMEDASLNDIKYALSNVSQRCEAFKDQMDVIVYYAGHGVPDDKTNEAYLLPVDGFGTDPKSGLNMEDFYESLSLMPAKSVVVLLDACFSGAKRDGGMLMATRGITIKPNMKVPDGKLIVLSATAEDQTAFPIEEQKHGLFTYTLLRKIQETNGDITWGELADYVTETVKTRSIDLAGKLQSPTVSVSPSIKDSWRNQKIR